MSRRWDPVACDVCGNYSGPIRDVRELTLKPGAAKWIKQVCPACRRRLSPQAETAAPGAPVDSLLPPDRAGAPLPERGAA